MTQLPIRILREPGVEVTDETGKLPPYVSALLSFAPQPLVGNGFIRSVVMVLPVVPGRADATNVLASA